MTESAEVCGFSAVSGRKARKCAVEESDFHALLSYLSLELWKWTDLTEVLGSA